MSLLTSSESITIGLCVAAGAALALIPGLFRQAVDSLKDVRYPQRRVLRWNLWVTFARSLDDPRRTSRRQEFAPDTVILLEGLMAEARAADFPFSFEDGCAAVIDGLAATGTLNRAELEAIRARLAATFQARRRDTGTRQGDRDPR